MFIFNFLELLFTLYCTFWHIFRRVLILNLIRFHDAWTTYGRRAETKGEKENENDKIVPVVCNQSLKTQITMLQCTIAGGRTKGTNERSFVFVHQHGGDDGT